MLWILSRPSVFRRPLKWSHVHACAITFLTRSFDRWVKKFVFFLRRKKFLFWLQSSPFICLCQNLQRNWSQFFHWRPMRDDVAVTIFLEERLERVDIFWTLISPVINRWFLHIVIRNINRCMSVEFCRYAVVVIEHWFERV